MKIYGLESKPHAAILIAQKLERFGDKIQSITFRQNESVNAPIGFDVEWVASVRFRGQELFEVVQLGKDTEDVLDSLIARTVRRVRREIELGSFSS